jgi:hypothetical protein
VNLDLPLDSILCCLTLSVAEENKCSFLFSSSFLISFRLFNEHKGGEVLFACWCMDRTPFNVPAFYITSDCDGS